MSVLGEKILKLGGLMLTNLRIGGLIAAASVLGIFPISAVDSGG